MNNENFSPFVNTFSHSTDHMLFVLTPLICVCHLFSSCVEGHPQIDLAVCIQQGSVSYTVEMNFKRIKKDVEAIN